MRVFAARVAALAVLAAPGCGGPWQRAVPPAPLGGEAERQGLAQRVDALVREIRELKEQLRTVRQENTELKTRIERLKELDRELLRLRQDAR